MFTITDELAINLKEISSVTTQVDRTTDRDLRGKTLKNEKDKYITKLVPWLSLSMNNGDKHNVTGLKDIYLFLDDPAVNNRRMWNSLVSKIKSYLEKDDEFYYLSEEDKDYLTKVI